MRYYSSINSYSLENDFTAWWSNIQILWSPYLHIKLCSLLKVAREESIHHLARHLRRFSVETEAWLFDGIQHVQVASICVTWDQLVAWWQCCKAQEHERSHQQCSVIAIFFEAHYDMGAPEHFLCIFQQGQKPFLGALRQKTWRHLDVQSVLP